MKNTEHLKKEAAVAALAYINDWNMTLGVGSGSTVHYFIDALPHVRDRIEQVVSTSRETTRRLQACGFSPVSLLNVDKVDVYIDGADEVDPQLRMIKGGGGALTQEKIVASSTKKFVCIAHANKYVEQLGTFPVAIEVIPVARSVVARAVVALNGVPEYREGFTTDNGNVILDVYGLDFTDPVGLEKTLNNIPGVVAHGIFAIQPANVLLLATEAGIIKR